MMDPVEESNNQTLVKKFRSGLKCSDFVLTIEPLVFLYTISVGLNEVIRSNVIIEKICRSKLNYSSDICSDLLNHTTVQEEVQTHVAEYETVYNSAAFAPRILFALLAGAWSDRNGRKWIIGLPILGQFLTCLTYLLNYVFLLQLPWQLLYLEFVNELCGTYVAYYLGVYSYITDVTEDKVRTVRLSIIDGVDYISTSVGTFSSGPLFLALGYYAVFGCSAAMCLLAIIYLFFRVQESLPLHKRQETQPLHQDNQTSHPHQDNQTPHPHQDNQTPHPHQDNQTPHPHQDSIISHPHQDTQISHPHQDSTISRPHQDTQISISRPHQDTQISSPNQDTRDFSAPLQSEGLPPNYGTVQSETVDEGAATSVKQTSKKCHGFLRITDFLEGVKTVLKPREGHRRLVVLLGIVNFVCFIFNYNGTEGTHRYSYARYKYEWTEQQFTRYITGYRVAYLVTLWVIMPVMTRVFHLRDATIAIVACLATIVGLLLPAFTSSSTWFTAGSFISMLVPVTTITARAIISKSVGEDEVGRIYSVLSLVSAASGSLVEAAYQSLYSATLQTFPGAYLLVNAGLLLITIGPNILIHKYIQMY